MERGRGGKGEREGWGDHLPYFPRLASASNTTLRIRVKNSVVVRVRVCFWVFRVFNQFGSELLSVWNLTVNVQRGKVGSVRPNSLVTAQCNYLNTRTGEWGACSRLRLFVWLTVCVCMHCICDFLHTIVSPAIGTFAYPVQLFYVYKTLLTPPSSEL